MMTIFGGTQNKLCYRKESLYNSWIKLTVLIILSLRSDSNKWDPNLQKLYILNSLYILTILPTQIVSQTISYDKTLAFFGYGDDRKDRLRFRNWFASPKNLYLFCFHVSFFAILTRVENLLSFNKSITFRNWSPSWLQTSWAE